MINLLPSAQKEELLCEKKYKLISICGFLFIVFLAAFSLALSAVETYMSGKIEGSRIAISPQLLDQEERISEINNNLQNLYFFYAGKNDFTKFLEIISRTVPDGISLTGLSLNFSKDKKNVLAAMQGVSPNRDILFQLKRNLESEPIFKDINFPPSSWVKPEKVEFSVSFKMEP